MTPAADGASWSKLTLEQSFVEQRLHEMGVSVVEKHIVSEAGAGELEQDHV